ncbi:MAG TPA: hypothetical protein DEA08_23710 [Planctomycetes bacterium]|nr:hypothetical protein [Planctomycetota bacterium]
MSFWHTNRILLVRVGSRAYGLETPQSDEDLRGVCVPPLDYLLGLETFEQHHEEEGDEETVALAKFVRLALEGAPNVVEQLFVDPADVLHTTRWGDRLRAEGPGFLSRRLGERLLGFARANWQRLEKHRRWRADQPPPEVTPADFGAQPGPQGNPRFPDEEARAAYRAAHKRWREFADWRSRRNPRRLALEERFGFDTKSAMHACRLLSQCEELVREGALVVRRPDAAWLRSIRAGEVSYEELRAWSEERLERLPSELAASELPARATVEGHALVAELQADFHGVELTRP